MWNNQRLAWCGVWLVLVGVATAAKAEVAEKVKQRLKLRTPVQDELLYELEKDFVELLQQSKQAEALLKAEQLLEETNDNTHWTNYSEASKILRATHDKAAIPLLLRYMVLHAKRSSCHVMIPEYCRAISLISAKELANQYESGPNLEARMRVKVQAIANNWWREAKDKLVTNPEKMTPEQRQVIVTRLLAQVRYDGDFTGSGGKRDTVYGAYHNVYYRLLSDDAAQRHAIAPLHPDMLPLFLAPCGYRADKSAKAEKTTPDFPYETVHILAELAKSGSHEAIHAIAKDSNQNTTVRMVCLLALYRAGYPYETELMLSLLPLETDLEQRLIIILSLRWGSPKAVPTLLQQMDDLNIDVATSAACALVDARPREAAPKLKKLLERDFVGVPLMLLSATAEFKTPETKELLRNLLEETLLGKRNREHLSRILDACVTAWDIPRNVYRGSEDRDYSHQAQLALDYCRQQIQQTFEAKKRLAVLVESLQAQLKVATEIETLRRAEYKRLLNLQGDGIVTPDESQQAHQHLQSASAEVETLRLKLREMELRLMSLNEKS